MRHMNTFYGRPEPEPGAGGGTGEPDPGAGAGTPPPEPQEGTSTSSSQERELAEARRDAARYRNELRTVQSKLEEIEGKDKSEAEKLREKEKKLSAEAKDLRDTNRALRVRVLAEDVGIVKEARTDASSLLDWSSIEDPDDDRQVLKALKELVKDRPYLQGNLAGGADGGAGGTGSRKPSNDPDALIRRMAGRGA